MTVSSTLRKAGPFNGNGVTTAFPFAFKVFAKTDIQLTHVAANGTQTVLVLDSDYSVALNADQDTSPGGTITYPLVGSPLPVSEILVGVGDLPAQQSTDITNLGRFLPQVHENVFDYLTILVQQLNETVGRTLQGSVSDVSLDKLPAVAARTGKVLGFDAVTGQPQASSYTMAQIVAALSNLSTAMTNVATLQDQTSRSLRFPSGEAALDLPAQASRQGKMLGFNAGSGQAEISTFTLTQVASVVAAIYAASAGPLDALSFLQAGVGAISRSAQDKARDIVSVFDFMTAAQIADVKSNTASLDVAAAVQAAINALKPTSGSTPSGGVTLKLPRGKYQFNSQVNAYSGIVLEGDGAGTIIVNGAGLVAGALFAPASMDGSNQYRFAGVKKMCLQPTGSVWGLQSTAGNVLNSVFEDITVNGPYGIDLSTNSYVQACTIQRILSLGAVEQILKLTGNFNHIHQIDKENGTGATTLPYVHTYCAANAGTNNGNLLSKILVEGTGSTNKAALRIENANHATLLDFWRETSANNGHILEVVGSAVSIMGTVMSGGTAGGVLSVTSGSYVAMDSFDASADDVDWANYFSVDSTSSLFIENLTVRRGSDQIPVNASPNIKFGRIVNTTQQGAGATAGFSVTQTMERRAGHNLLMNPSFEAGDYGWTFSTAPSLKEFLASDVGPGLMLHAQASGTGFQVTQSITIPAGWVGMPVTMRFIGKCDGGFVVPIIDGASALAINRVNAGAGYQHIIATFTLATSGAQNFGVWWAGASAGNSLWLDEFTLGIGTDVNINPARFQSFELNGCTWTTGTAAPTTGTWKRGDRLVNSAPAVGSPKAWSCTVAGSPGTWVSEGNL